MGENKNIKNKLQGKILENSINQNTIVYIDSKMYIVKNKNGRNIILQNINSLNDCILPEEKVIECMKDKIILKNKFETLLPYQIQFIKKYIQIHEEADKFYHFMTYFTLLIMTEQIYTEEEIRLIRKYLSSNFSNITSKDEKKSINELKIKILNEFKKNILINEMLEYQLRS